MAPGAMRSIGFREVHRQLVVGFVDSDVSGSTAVAKVNLDSRPLPRAQGSWRSTGG